MVRWFGDPVFELLRDARAWLRWVDVTLIAPNADGRRLVESPDGTCPQCRRAVPVGPRVSHRGRSRARRSRVGVRLLRKLALPVCGRNRAGGVLGCAEASRRAKWRVEALSHPPSTTSDR